MTPAAKCLLTKLASLTRLALDIDTQLWAGYYSSPEVAEVAYASKEKIGEKCDRIKRVLDRRYGVDLYGVRGTEIAGMA